MMIFSVFDVKVEAYMAPFYARTEAEAKRSFLDAVSKEGHEFQKHREDYSLWKVGYWHEESGGLESVTPMQLCTAMEVAMKEIRADG